jgi:hypothetical protein
MIKTQEDSVRTVIVTTTIHVPVFLQEYMNNQKYYGHSDVKYIVVSDKKTPSEARGFCESLPDTLYLGEKEQLDFLKRFPALGRHLPWNDIARRNIGHLWAYEEEGADVLVMLDDDNLATSDDFIKHHQQIDQYMPTIESTTGWLNPCVVLKEENDVEFYPRGYAPKHRWEPYALNLSKRQRLCTAVNVGLWIGDPDVDAITRLERPLKTKGYKWWGEKNITLYPGTWCPWNCQNTAIARRVIPAYFLSPFCGRHLDIWASYVVNRIAGHLNEGVNFGRPLANHVRSPHNLYRDLEEETPWIEMTDEFCDSLRSTVLTSDTYLGCSQEIVRQIEDKIEIYADRVSEGMEIWGECFSKLGD